MYDLSINDPQRISDEGGHLFKLNNSSHSINVTEESKGFNSSNNQSADFPTPTSS